MAQITLNSTGVASSGALTLQSNGTTNAVTVDTSQNVGIGTTSPASKLDVRGNASFSGNATSRQTANFTNTGGDFYVGAESSAGGAVFGGSSAYAGIVGTNNATSLQFASNAVIRATIDSSGNVGIGNTSPSRKFEVTGSGDVYSLVETTGTTGTTGLLFGDSASDASGRIEYVHSADVMQFTTASTERARIDSSGNVGIGTTSLDNVGSTTSLTLDKTSGNGQLSLAANGTVRGRIFADNSSSELRIGNPTSNPVTFFTANTERMRIDSSGNLLVAKTALDSSTVGCILRANGEAIFVGSSVEPLTINRNTSDGTLVSFRQDNTQEGTISVSGTTVSYNGGHLSRWAQTTAPKDDTLVKGTVLSNLDAMNVYTDADGNPVDNEQLNKVKVSDIEGDVNVAGVFVNWTHDDAHNVDEINMAMTGDMIIRIAQGTTVQRGDLLMSAGDGTAKPQGDDIVRSKTVAKVTSTHVTCTYPDGSFCVPCVLMAC